MYRRWQPFLQVSFERLENPYAINYWFQEISKKCGPDVADVFYVWDPLLTNTYFGLGGYQTIMPPMAGSRYREEL